MSDIERAAFEQAVADKWSDSYKFTRFGDEDYYDEVLEGMWQGWQASRQALEGEPEWQLEAKRAFWAGIEIAECFNVVAIAPRWDEYIAKRKEDLSQYVTRAGDSDEY